MSLCALALTVTEFNRKFLGKIVKPTSEVMSLSPLSIDKSSLFRMFAAMHNTGKWHTFFGGCSLILSRFPSHYTSQVCNCTLDVPEKQGWSKYSAIGVNEYVLAFMFIN